MQAFMGMAVGEYTEQFFEEYSGAASHLDDISLSLSRITGDKSIEQMYQKIMMQSNLDGKLPIE